MNVTTEELVWILVRYIMDQEKKTQDEIVIILLREALVGRGMLKPLTEEIK